MKGVSHTDPAGHDFGVTVMEFLNRKTAQWRDAENISYSLYGNPMEISTYKFARCLQRRFGIIPNVTDHNYITNSYHVVVREPIKEEILDQALQPQYLTLFEGILQVSTVVAYGERILTSLEVSRYGTRKFYGGVYQDGMHFSEESYEDEEHALE